ncbi:hypothetical protein EI427_10810 [Flammeovirga pectinis]|uniref:Uncharacterized protein n=1 Tax=Flammeovirga pectinis TaxID=2494373 RepID=A0A3S9P3C2_9BACT|nr:hypothetical protein [Flammeovirga pectinis]AZQ62710.1 hypothetical protein EI427_10810 [Flammeovirga pectinis]
METKKVFNTISVFLHPIFIPCLIAGLFLFGVNEAPWLDNQARWSLFSLIGTISTLMPISFLLLMQRFGIIESPHLHSRDERSFALSVMVVSFGLICYILYVKINVSTAMNIAFTAVTITLIIANIANFIDKISLHAIGMAGLAGILLYFITEETNANIILFDAFGFSLILLGLSMTARLYLKAHTQYQVYAGAILGFFSGYFGAILGGMMFSENLI